MTSCARHDLVWLSEPGWKEALSDVPAPALLQHWREKNWPAIVRRRDADANPGELCIGIAPAPQAGNKQRIGLRVPLAGIATTVAPLSLETVIPVLPHDWQAPLVALCSAAAAEKIFFRAYGSAALQYLTGEQYLTPASDIDLLFHPRTHVQLAAGIALLSAHASLLPLDGEIVFPNGQAVAWKEWSAAINGARVLVKDMRTVRLMKTTELLDTLEDAR